MKKTLILAAFMACTLSSMAQAMFGEKPKLVVGIVVDQMRWDYLSRYYDRFESDGFRRLIDQGYSCNNCLINYLPTVTAIGHTSVYTGTTPAFHGICGNNYYERGEKKYCVEDKSVKTVGSNSEKGQMSPINLLATTIGDQLRLHTDFESKVIGVSYKDRAAILPAGRSANAAYWLDTKNMQFVTSTYYMNELPEWAKKYNKALAANKEAKKAGEKIGLTALCGTVTTDMAIATLEGEQLGMGKATDMLCVSYSQTDVIGHEWGTRAPQTHEAYLTLDRDLARLFAALDRQVGKGNYLVFLTADHGASHNNDFLREHKMSAGKWEEPGIKDEAEAYIKERLGNAEKVILGEMDYRYFLDHKSIERQGLNINKVKEVLVEFLKQKDECCFVVDYENMQQQTLPQIIRDYATMGYHMRRSGDVLAVPNPGYYTHASWSTPTGTTHGEWNPYDSHIPLLFYGWKIEHGATSREVHINDIAPTVCQLLHIQQTNACTGQAITEITR